MQFYFSRQGVSKIDIDESSITALASTQAYRQKTIPFSHIYLSSNKFFEQLNNSISPQEQSELQKASGASEIAITQHARCPKNLSALNIKKPSDWHTHFEDKSVVHIFLLGNFDKTDNPLENIDALETYIKRLTRLLAPVKVFFHLTHSLDALLTKQLKEQLQKQQASIQNVPNLAIYPDCITVSQFFKADFYLDINTSASGELQTQNLPLYDSIESNVNQIQGVRTQKPKVAVVIPHFGSQEKLNLCLDALANVKGFDPQWLYIVDNNSNNRYFTIGVNHGLEQAIKDDCDYFWVLNNDTQPYEDYLLASLARFDVNANVGIVGGKNLVTERPDRIFWGGSYNAFPTGSHKAGYVSRGNLNTATQESWATFSSVIIRGETLKRCGLLDSSMRMIFSDSDYCFHVGMKGWQVWYEPEAVILHDTGVSRSAPNKEIIKIFREDKRKFYHKWVKLTGCKDPEELQAAIFKKIQFKVET